MSSLSGSDRNSIMTRLTCSSICSAILLALHIAASAVPRDKLLLILVDGVRSSYMEELNLKGFSAIASNGVKAEYVTPVFPSNSYPNWYTIVTGLYAEDHGFVQNFMYDQERNAYFLMAPDPNASHPHWWNQAEPLWITAEKNKIKTAMYWWDGCQVVMDDHRATHCIQYRDFWKWKTVNADTTKALMDILNAFETDKYDLAMVYYEAVDANGHAHGPASTQRKQSLRGIDAIIDTLLKKISDKKLEDKVNVMVVSDHGMSASDANSTKTIDLEEHIDLEDIVVMLDRGSLTMILPESGKTDKVYNDLKRANIQGLSVYKKEEIPWSYHIKNNRLVMPLLLVAKEGFFIKALSNSAKMKPVSSYVFNGFHGYDPAVTTNMRTIFYAVGPAFKNNYTIGPLEMVDHYNVMCHVLGIEPLRNSGSWKRVRAMLKNGGSHPLPFSWCSLLFPAVSLIVMIQQQVLA